MILERFLEAKIFEKKLSVFAKNNQRINIYKKTALDESVKKPCFGKISLKFPIKKTDQIYSF